MCCCVGPRFKNGRVFVDDSGTLITKSDLSIRSRCNLLFKKTNPLCIKTTTHCVQKTVMHYFHNKYNLSYLLLAKEAKVDLNNLMKSSLRVGDFLAMQKLASNKNEIPETAFDNFLGKSLQRYTREKNRRVTLTHETDF